MSGCVGLCSILFLSLSFVVSAVPLHENSDTQFTTPNAVNDRRTQTVTIAALVCSSLSMVSSLIAFWWVCRMDKQFRHRLLMLLICGDLIRASCFFVGAVVMLAHGTVTNESPFCQSSGFFIVFGTETSDYAVLMMAIHTALQVFRPSGQTPSEGLYPYRRYVYAGAFCAPVTSASLAFINQQGGYLLQGAFCLLPIRPFWYRLALVWVPRYLIALIIISLAIAIYTYVGWEFKSYNKISKKLGYTTTEDIAGTNISISALHTKGSFISNHDAPGAGLATRPGSNTTQQKLLSQYSQRTSVASQEAFSTSGRRWSASSPYNEPGGASGSTSIRAASTSPTRSFSRSTRRIHCKHSGPTRPPLGSIPSGHTVRPLKSNDNLRPPASMSHQDTLSGMPALSPFLTVSLPHADPPSPGFNRMVRQRARIHRQLRVMFIYPIVYTLMWLLPFVYHCMMYNDYYASHPVYVIRLANSICIASMGFVNFVVFSLRETPWRGMPNSDGTLLGSFFVWNASSERGRTMGRVRGGGRRPRSAGGFGCAARDDNDDVAAQRSLSDGGLCGPGRSLGSSASFYGYSRAERNWARERLEWEREERYRVLREQAARAASRPSSVGRRGSLSESSCCGQDGADEFDEDLGEATLQQNRRCGLDEGGGDKEIEGKSSHGLMNS